MLSLWCDSFIIQLAPFYRAAIRSAAIKETDMPSISMFYGIIIRMFVSGDNAGEHNPPHFHAFYQGQEGVFDLEGEMIKGSMSCRQQKLIAAWAELRKRACFKDELAANWQLA